MNYQFNELAKKYKLSNTDLALSLLPKIGTVFNIGNMWYKVIHTNTGNYRFSAIPHIPNKGELSRWMKFQIFIQILKKKLMKK